MNPTSSSHVRMMWAAISFAAHSGRAQGKIPLLSWSMWAVKQPSPPALHHVPVTTAVGGSQLLICCLELASSGLASVKPLNDKTQALSASRLAFSMRTNEIFCLRRMDDCWQTHTETSTLMCAEKTCLNTHTHIHKYQHRRTNSPHCPLCFLQAKHRRCMTCLRLDACCCVPRQFLECVTDDVFVVGENMPAMAHGCGLQEFFSQAASGKKSCREEKRLFFWTLARLMLPNTPYLGCPVVFTVCNICITVCYLFILWP